MKKNTEKKLKISIGIPAYNEEANIKNLLERLLNQRLNSQFKLHEIILIFDGSTDETVAITKSIKSPLIKTIKSKARLGQQARQNQLISTFKGDVLVIIEADTLPYNLNTINNLVTPFIKNRSEKLDMVVGKALSLPPKTLIEKIECHGMEIKYRLFSEWQNGLNPFMTEGHALRALSRSFATKLKWPTDVPEDTYIYFRLKQLGLQMKKTESARTLVKRSASLNDLVRRNKKFIGGVESLKKYFPKDLINKEFTPPLKLMMKHLVINFFKSPILTIFYLLQFLLVRTVNFRVKEFDPLYQPFGSTKNLSSYEKSFVTIATDHLKSKKPTVSIGIPAYNEEANICSLLHNIREQKLLTATLKKIIVYSDASTDGTLDVLTRMKMKSLRVMSGKKRMGKSYAMNQIIKKTTSDILVLLDGDILIRDNQMVEKLIEPILLQHADLTSARVKEFWTNTKFEEILKISMLLKKDIFESYKQGNNIYTCHGRARAFSKKLYTSILFNKNIVAEDAFAYLYTIYNKFTYIFAKNANIHYRLPGTFKDHQKQSVRFIQSYKQLAKEFGKSFIQQETKLSKRVALPFVFQYFLKYPLTIFLYVSILVYMRFRSLFVSEMTNKWQVSESTKGVFSKVKLPQRQLINNR